MDTPVQLRSSLDTSGFTSDEALYSESQSAVIVTRANKAGRMYFMYLFMVFN
jgi:hypothetical protein